jgi:hypothetical protein
MQGPPTSAAMGTAGSSSPRQRPTGSRTASQHPLLTGFHAGINPYSNQAVQIDAVPVEQGNPAACHATLAVIAQEVRRVLTSQAQQRVQAQTISKPTPYKYYDVYRVKITLPNAELTLRLLSLQDQLQLPILNEAGTPVKGAPSCAQSLH